MAQFYKKTSLGRMVTAERGIHDPSLAEVRLTPAEYENLLDRMRAAENAVETARDEADRRVEEAYKDANRQLDAYKSNVSAEADRRVKIAQSAREQAEIRESRAISEKDEMQAALKKQQYLNSNLKRIARERANADRGIKPKKEHDGYLVLSSRQWVEHYDHELTEEEYDDKPEEFKRRYRLPFTEHLTADVWKSVIQTPYDASLPLNQIRAMVEDTDLWDNGILEDIGCPKMNANDINGRYHTFGVGEEGYEKNGMYKWKFIANYKSGYWELEIYTTKSLRVPENRRPQYKKRRKKDEQKQNPKVSNDWEE